MSLFKPASSETGSETDLDTKSRSKRGAKFHTNSKSIATVASKSARYQGETIEMGVQ